MEKMQLSGTVVWLQTAISFSSRKNAVNVYSVRTLCVELSEAADSECCAESLLLPDPTTCVKLSLQTRWPSHSADEGLGRWEACCIASCFRRGEIMQQAPLGAAGLAADCTHCSWTSKSAWAKSISSLWRCSGHVAGMRGLCQITLHPCCRCLDSQLSGNLCLETCP